MIYTLKKKKPKLTINVEIDHGGECRVQIRVSDLANQLGVQVLSPDLGEEEVVDSLVAGGFVLVGVVDPLVVVEPHDPGRRFTTLGPAYETNVASLVVDLDFVRQLLVRVAVQYDGPLWQFCVNQRRGFKIQYFYSSNHPIK